MTLRARGLQTEEYVLPSPEAGNSCRFPRRGRDLIALHQEKVLVDRLRVCNYNVRWNSKGKITILSFQM